MTRLRIGLTLLGFALICSVALAEEEIPLGNWAAPPYWTPPVAESSATPGAVRGSRTALAGREMLVTFPSPLPFVAVAPCRVIDTRPGSGFPAGYGQPSITGGGTQRTFVIAGQCGTPADARAVSFNFAVWAPTTRGDLRVFPAGGATPAVSTLNWEANILALANAAVVPLGSGGDITVQVDGPGTVDIFADVNGYYSPLGVVNNVNTLSGDVTLSAGTNVTITPSGNTLTIASTAGGGPPSGPAGGGLAGTYPNPTVVSTSLNVGGAIVSRDADGGFQAGSLSLSGNLSLPLLSLPSAGMVTLNGKPFLHAPGEYNTFAGRDAGNTLMGGDFNVAFGAVALHSNTSGLENVAFGTGALTNNTSGWLNTALGGRALGNNTTSFWNTAVGVYALYSQSFDNAGIELETFNTAVGAEALFFNNPTTAFNGIFNTAVGASSLFANTTGSQNTAVGYMAGARTGAGAGYGGLITFVANTIGTYNTFVGYGTGATADVFNCTTVGIDAYCDGNNQVRLGNSWVTSIGGKVGWSALSDARAKKEIRDLALGLDFVLKLRPVEYKLKAGNERTDMGFLAQDIEALLGEDYNVLTVGGDSDRTLSLRYSDLIAPLVKAMQEQQAMLLKDRDEIRALQARLRQLESSRAALNRPRVSP